MAQVTRAGQLLIVVAGLSLLGYAAHRSGMWGRLRAGAPDQEAGAEPQGDAPAATLTFVYGTEKERWLKAAVEQFRAANPQVEVELKGMGTIDSVRAIAEGREQPTIWSPADEVAVNLLETEWSLQKGGAIIPRGGEFEPRPLVLTPLVVIVWEERAKALAASGRGEPTDWKLIHQLATDPRGWRSLGSPAEWGFVKLGHTAPNASNSGLQTLILMAYGYHGKTTGLTAEDVLDPGFQKWLKEMETAVGKFGASSGTYMRDMILYGPSRYDLIWNYESVAIGDMSAAQGRWGNLAVYYPKPTLWSNHPFVVPDAPWVTKPQREAARRLRDFLLSPAMQSRALEFGFRPANPDVKVLTGDPQNPWNRLKALGVHVEVPAVAEPPSGEVSRLLLETWRRVVSPTAR